MITVKYGAKCACEPQILIFHQKLKFAKNVTYDLIAFSRRIGSDKTYINS